jgi:hypothetical protein
MMGNPNIGSGRGTRLRALDAQTRVPPNGAEVCATLSFVQYSSIPTFHNSNAQ